MQSIIASDVVTILLFFVTLLVSVHIRRFSGKKYARWVAGTGSHTAFAAVPALFVLVFFNPLQYELMTILRGIIYTSLLFTFIALILTYNTKLISAIKGDKTILTDSPSFLVNESDILDNSSYRTIGNDFFICVREGGDQYYKPVRSFDDLLALSNPSKNVEKGATCCRCGELKPICEKIAHLGTWQPVGRHPICEECIVEFIEDILESEDNYIDESVLVSRNI